MADVRQALDGRRPSACICCSSFSARSHLHTTAQAHKVSQVVTAHKPIAHTSATGPAGAKHWPHDQHQPSCCVDILLMQVYPTSTANCHGLLPETLRMPKKRCYYGLTCRAAHRQPAQLRRCLCRAHSREHPWQQTASGRHPAAHCVRSW